MGTDWAWNSDKRPVSMTEDVAKMLVREIAAEVSSARQNEMLDQYRQFAKVEMDLMRAREEAERAAQKHREEIERANAEIVALRVHIDNLNQIITRVTSTPAVQFTPYNNNGSIPAPVPPIAMTYPTPSFTDRYSFQVPPVPSAPPAASTFDVPLQTTYSNGSPE